MCHKLYYSLQELGALSILPGFAQNSKLLVGRCCEIFELATPTASYSNKQIILSICSLLRAVIDTVRFFLVPSSFLMSAVISVIVISVRIARSLTLSMLSNSSARSFFAVLTLRTLASFVANWVATNWEIWSSRSETWLCRACAVAGTDDNVAGWEKSSLRWSIGSYWAQGLNHQLNDACTINERKDKAPESSGSCWALLMDSCTLIEKKKYAVLA